MSIVSAKHGAGLPVPCTWPTIRQIHHRSRNPLMCRGESLGILSKGAFSLACGMKGAHSAVTAPHRALTVQNEVLTQKSGPSLAPFHPNWYLFMMIRPLLPALLICLLSSMTLKAIAQPRPVVFDKHTSLRVLDIEANTVFVEDTTSAGLNVSQIMLKKFAPLAERRNDRRDGMDHTTKATWLHFRIQNNKPDTLHVLYTCNLHFKIEVYAETKLIDTHGFIMGLEGRRPAALTIPPAATINYYIRVENRLVSVLPLKSELLSPEKFFESEVLEQVRIRPLFFLLTLMCGSFLFMSVFAFFHYCMNRDVAFLYYACCAMLIFENGMVGISNRFGIGLLNINLLYAYFIFYILFLNRMTDIRQISPRTWTMIRWLVIVNIGLQAISLWEHFVTQSPLFENVLFYRLQFIPGLVLVGIGLIFTLRSKSNIRNYLSAGILSVVLIGFVPLLLDPYFEMPYNQLEAIVNYPVFYAFVGFTIENFCFAMALAYRTNQSDKEKIELQKNYAARIENELAVRTTEIEHKSKQLEEQKIRQLTVEFQRKLQATEMTALRAQMNPHFIFNCLNSIKLYTLENDAHAASEYLTKFSRLIRLVLENSAQEKISLDSELETLQLYIDMETMRFKTKFSFQFEIDPAIDTDFVEIPPMLIQPYVENAIWHGLMHKEGQGNLTLTISQPADDILQVEIIDDGIGRARAAEYKSKSATRHKSFGLKVSSERIALINQRSKNEMMVRIEDLVDPEGNSAGTRAILTIPL